MEPARPICVLGLGLIGGSLARAAKAAGRTVWAATASDATAEAARAAGFSVETSTDDALARADAADALVVLAMPLPAVAGVLRRVHAVAPRCRLTDVVSVKARVRDLVAEHAPEARYVGGHPMAGTAESGWAAGSATLFDGANWVIGTDDDVDAEVWADVAELAWDCAARVVPAGAAEHDASVARVSHLPHLLAAVLASVAASDGPAYPGAGPDPGLLPLTLAAGSFSDGTRVMDTRPELVLAMCEGNRAGLLAAVDDALGRLGAARGSLASTGGLAATVNAGHAARQRWQAARHAPEVRVHRDSKPAELRELGRLGQVVVGFTDSSRVASP
ncbi:MAG TPA: prephenate dehydrogenase, partial [Pseudonocardia sp.]